MSRRLLLASLMLATTAVVALLVAIGIGRMQPPPVVLGFRLPVPHETTPSQYAGIIDLSHPDSMVMARLAPGHFPPRDIRRFSRPQSIDNRFTYAYRRASQNSETLVFGDLATGREIAITGVPFPPQFSPDRTLAAVRSERRNQTGDIVSDLHIVNLAAWRAWRLPSSMAAYSVSWSAHNRLILYDDETIIIAAPDLTTRDVIQLPDHHTFHDWPRFSPDGAYIAYMTQDHKIGSLTLWLYDLAAGTAHIIREGEEVYYRFENTWSPDSRWLTYQVFIRRDGIGNDDVQVHIVNPRTRTTRLLTHYPLNSITTEIWMPDGHHLALTHRKIGSGSPLGPGYLQLIGLDPGMPIANIQGITYGIWSEDGRYVVADADSLALEPRLLYGNPPRDFVVYDLENLDSPPLALPPQITYVSWLAGTRTLLFTHNELGNVVTLSTFDIETGTLTVLVDRISGFPVSIP